MLLSAIKENDNNETRVSISPESVKLFSRLGFEVIIESGSGVSANYHDSEYEAAGATIGSREDALACETIITIRFPGVNGIKAGTNLACVSDPFRNPQYVKDCLAANITLLSMDMIPRRLSRAQSMDVNSSQDNLAGYKAVLLGAAHVPKGIPMMTTSAGTVRPAKVVIMGSGVAGLQAIATAKRMGAIVFATDVRMASKEQVESLGGKFLTVEGAENLETEGGYAKEASDDFKKKQEELLSETLKKIDIVICTALIPGKKAPIIIKEDMINNMKAGSIIYDLAAIQGGNTAHTKVDEIVDKNGVKIMGESNILNKLPTSASNLYAKNVFNFVSNLYDKENKKININLEDEIIEKTLIK